MTLIYSKEKGCFKLPCSALSLFRNKDYLPLFKKYFIGGDDSE